MKLFTSSACSLVLLFVSGAARAQDFKASPSKKPDDATLELIGQKTTVLRKALSSLRNQGVGDPWLADAEIYHKAAVRIMQHDEFFQAESTPWTLEALDRGMLRAKFLSEGKTPWATAFGYPVVRAYRSRIDGSVQPYAVTYPASYAKDATKKWRVDVVLHGRDKNLNEVKFLHQYNGDKSAPADQPFIQISIYGRGNNAYRWAGETDVFEALDHFVNVENGIGRGKLIDQDRIVLRGFSMGGAGTWHLGLHWPDRWCVLGPGAGFTSTHGYIKNLPAKLPAHQEACLHIYDAVDYAENAFNVPIVAYSGAKDPQMQAAVNIETRLKSAGIPMTHIVAPDLEHKFPPERQKKMEVLYAKQASQGRPEYAPRVRFLTYTMRYPTCHWVEILGLDKHYERTLVDAERTDTGYVIKTTNVRGLHLTLPVGPPLELTVKIDDQTLTPRPWLNQQVGYHIYLMRRDGKWTSILPQRLLTERAHQPQKLTGLQGPIDDAFTDGFLCVRGTGKAWHPAVDAHAQATLKRFESEWAKYFRGQVPIKDDTDVTNEDIAGKHLILFGDPGSNSLIAQVLDGLPLGWTRETITFAGGQYSAAEHLPALIHPSPLNASRYVVLNSGHTFHAADFQGTNALLYPRLGDFAILRLAAADAGGASPVVVGLFDEFWRVPKR